MKLVGGRWRPGGLRDVKNLPANAQDTGSTPGSGRSPGEGHGTPFQYSCLGNPMDRGAWRATVHAVAESRTHLSTRACTHHRDGPSPALVPLTASQPSEAGRAVWKAARPATELPAAGVLPTRCPSLPAPRYLAQLPPAQSEIRSSLRSPSPTGMPTAGEWSSPGRGKVLQASDETPTRRPAEVTPTRLPRSPPKDAQVPFCSVRRSRFISP